MTTVNIHEAKTNFSRLVERVEGGETEGERWPRKRGQRKGVQRGVTICRTMPVVISTST